MIVVIDQGRKTAYPLDSDSNRELLRDIQTPHGGTQAVGHML
jgi:hypothetical protein